MIRVPITSETTLKKYLFENKDIVYRHIVSLIGEALDSGSSYIEFLQFGNSQFYAGLTLKNFSKALHMAMDYFVGKELYEDAQQCKELIVRATIEDVTKWIEDEK